MKRRIYILIAGLILIITSACSSKPVISVELYRTSTPVQTFSEAFTPALPIVPTNTAILETPPLPTSPVTSVMVPDFSPVLYGKKYDANTFFLLLGGMQAGAWLTPEQAAARFGGEWDYDVYSLEQQVFSVRGYSPEFSPTSNAYFLKTDSTVNEFGMVGVLRGWPVRQGNVQELASENDTYQKVVLDWLESEGIPMPTAGTLRIYRVDLEADGVDETFIAATSMDEAQPLSTAGDYSVVLMRKVAGNSVITIPLVADLYISEQNVIYPASYSIGNFIDLNHDGIMEVILEIRGWETFGGLVYQVNGETVMQLFK